MNRRGNVPNCHIAFEFGLCELGRPQWGIENPKRISAVRSSFESYSRFTGILAYDKICTEKPNDDISTLNFAHRWVYWCLACHKNFSPNGCIFYEILNSPKARLLHHRFEKNVFFLEIQYLVKGTFI